MAILADFEYNPTTREKEGGSSQHFVRSTAVEAHNRNKRAIPSFLPNYGTIFWRKKVMKAIAMRIATFVVVTLILALANTAWADVYEFTEEIAPAPKSVPSPTGLYNWREKKTELIGGCTWYKKNTYRNDQGWHWVMGGKHTPRRIKKCCMEVLYTWDELLKLYLENLVHYRDSYRDDYDVAIYISYGGTFTGNDPFTNNMGIEDHYFRKFFNTKILKYPKAVAALYKWARPYLDKAIKDMDPITCAMYKAALEHGLEYLDSVNMRAERAYLKGLEEDDEEDEFNDSRPDGSSSRFRKMETFLFRRLNDGVSKNLLRKYLKEGIKLLKENLTPEEMTLAKAELIEEDINRWRYRDMVERHQKYLDLLNELGEIQGVCIASKFHVFDLPPKEALLKLSFMDLLKLQRRIFKAWWPEMYEEIEYLQDVLIPETRKEAARLAMYDEFMDDMDDLFGVCCMEP